jgi:hypothetical protein
MVNRMKEKLPHLRQQTGQPQVGKIANPFPDSFYQPRKQGSSPYQS